MPLQATPSRSGRILKAREAKKSKPPNPEKLLRLPSAPRDRLSTLCTRLGYEPPIFRIEQQTRYKAILELNVLEGPAIEDNIGKVEKAGTKKEKNNSHTFKATSWFPTPSNAKECLATEASDTLMLELTARVTDMYETGENRTTRASRKARKDEQQTEAGQSGTGSHAEHDTMGSAPLEGPGASQPGEPIEWDDCLEELVFESDA